MIYILTNHGNPAVGLSDRGSQAYKNRKNAEKAMFKALFDHLCKSTAISLVTAEAGFESFYENIVKSNYDFRTINLHRNMNYEIDQNSVYVDNGLLDLSISEVELMD